MIYEHLSPFIITNNIIIIHIRQDMSGMYLIMFFFLFLYKEFHHHHHNETIFQFVQTLLYGLKTSLSLTLTKQQHQPFESFSLIKHHFLPNVDSQNVVTIHHPSHKWNLQIFLFFWCFFIHRFCL